MSRRTGLAVPLLASVFLAAPLPLLADATTPFGLTGTHIVSPDGVSYTMYSGKVPSFDGLPIAADVTIPDGYVAPGPLLVMIHGWTGDRTTFESTTVNGDPSAPYAPELADWNNLAFAKRGYAVLNYSTRGMEGSCGPKAAAVQGIRQTLPPECTATQYWVHLADPKWEIHDAQFLIGTLVDQGFVDPSRIGVTGWSYGAGHSLLLAAYNDRTVNADGSTSQWQGPTSHVPVHIAAAVPLYGWASLVGSVFPNGRPTERSFGAELATTPVGIPVQSYLSALWAEEDVKRFYAPPGADPSADINGWFVRWTEGDPYHDDSTDPVTSRMLSEFDRRSALYLSPNGAVPIYMVEGFTDDVFPALQGVQMRNHLLETDSNYPIESFFGDVGHLLATNESDVVAVWHAAGHAFLDHYLKGVGPTPDSDVTVMTNTCGGQTRRTFVSPSWDDLTAGGTVVSSSNRQITTSLLTGYEAIGSDPHRGPASGSVAGADVRDHPGRHRSGGCPLGVRRQ